MFDSIFLLVRAVIVGILTMAAEYQYGSWAAIGTMAVLLVVNIVIEIIITLVKEYGSTTNKS